MRTTTMLRELVNSGHEVTFFKLEPTGPTELIIYNSDKGIQKQFSGDSIAKAIKLAHTDFAKSKPIRTYRTYKTKFQQHEKV